MEIKPLNWDSQFFNKKIGEIILFDDKTNSIDAEGYDLLYVKSEHDFPITIKGFKNSFAELKLTFSKDLSKKNEKENECIKSVFELDIKNKDLYDLALLSGKFSRYKLDDKFNNSTFVNLYKKWIDNSMNKTFADDVFLYLEDKNILGLISYKKFKDYGKVGLFSVDLASQGKGIGTQLLSAVELKMYKSGLKKLEIPTQAKNKQACEFYSKSGYTIVNQVYIKHFWKA